MNEIYKSQDYLWNEINILLFKMKSLGKIKTLNIPITPKALLILYTIDLCSLFSNKKNDKVSIMNHPHCNEIDKLMESIDFNKYIILRDTQCAHFDLDKHILNCWKYPTFEDICNYLNLEQHQKDFKILTEIYNLSIKNRKGEQK